MCSFKDRLVGSAPKGAVTVGTRAQIEAQRRMRGAVTPAVGPPKTGGAVRGAELCDAHLKSLDLRTISLKSLTGLVASEPFGHTVRSFYGEPGSRQAAVCLQRFMPLYERLSPSLPGVLAMDMSVLPFLSPPERQQMLLNCATLLRLHAQAHPEVHDMRLFKGVRTAQQCEQSKKQGVPVWGSTGVGSIKGWGACRIGDLERLARKDSRAFHLPVQKLDPVNGPGAIAYLPLYPFYASDSCVKRYRNSCHPFIVPGGAQIASVHSDGLQVWELDAAIKEVGFSRSFIWGIDSSVGGKSVTAAVALKPGVFLFGCYDGSIMEWKEDKKPRTLFNAARADVVGLFMLESGVILTGSITGVITLWRGEGSLPTSSPALDKEERLHSMQLIAADRFITRSTDDMIRVWQIQGDSFYCIAVLDPLLAGQPDIIVWDAQTIAQLREHRATDPDFGQQSLRVLSNNRVIRVGQEERPPILMYDLCSPHNPQGRTALWSTPQEEEQEEQQGDYGSAIEVPVWQPITLPEELSDGRVVLLEALPDGRLVVVSHTGRIVLYDPCTHDVLVLYSARPQSPQESPKYIESGLVTEDGFIWLCDNEGSVFVIDPSAVSPLPG